MVSFEVYKLVLSVAIILQLTVCSGLYMLLHRLDKLRYGEDDMQLIDHVVIVVKIGIAIILVSQLWLYQYLDNTDLSFFLFFLCGALLLFICFRGSFREVRTAADVGVYASVLGTLLFLSGTCLAMVFYCICQIRGGGNAALLSLLLHRFFMYGGGAILCTLLSIGCYAHRQQQGATNVPANANLMPAVDENGRLSAFV